MAQGEGTAEKKLAGVELTIRLEQGKHKRKGKRGVTMIKLCSGVLALMLLASGITGCSKPKITEEQAKAVVSEQHFRNSAFGPITIVSITHSNEGYAVKWERPNNCEAGTSYVDDKEGKVLRAEVSIC
ncbi:hypothetical protein [Paenibacillus sp. y28]|uniref:hypothetical protein n=1 Tax=Paenibacillus sp. y28 TaxID=3129110 RepID=UPI0030175137